MENTTSLWIDALDFEEKGGWLEDTQYVHLMGSGYLIAAHEPGVPVEDATISVNLPKEGVYRVWVRSRNWLRPHNPGIFNLIVNGDNNGVVLGAQPSDAWVWEIAGDHFFKAGENTLALHDLSGYFARCASILITNDYDYLPSREIERIHKDRAAFRGEDYRVKEGGTFDVIVAGGGPGGVPAAIAAARHGAKTLLLQNRSVLGGNGSAEVGITFDGAAVAHIYSRETGIAEEIRRLRDADPNFAGDWGRAMAKLCMAEPNLTVICDTHVYNAEMADEETIKGVEAINIRTLQKIHFEGKIFIDCTGDAWLGYYAGAKMRFGRESIAQHGEKVAAEIADTLTMSGCIKGDTKKFFEKMDHPVEYHAPAWVPKLPEDDAEFGRVINGARLQWWLEAPNTYDDMWDGEETRDALLMVVLGFYDHLKNHWSKKDSVTNHRLIFASVFDGRRESRRMIGDYIMTQQDCESSCRFEDVITYTGWAIDIHHPEGIYSGKKGPLYYAQSVKQPQVPYRCLYSKNIKNLMMAGRNISVTHVALGTVRVQNTIVTLGQAAGTAAAMCVALNETPRGIYQNHIKALQQQLLKDDQFIPGIKNEDENDPCRTAKATASSVSSTEVFRDEMGVVGPLYPLNTLRRARLRVHLPEDVTSLYCKLASDNDTPTSITMHAYTMGGDIDTYSAPGEVVTAQGIVPPKSEGWVKFDFEDHPLKGGGAIMATLEPAEGVSWRVIDKLTFYSWLSYTDERGNWKSEGSKTYWIRTGSPKKEILANCAPENVVNGFSRITDEEHYEWVSDPKEALPQWINLDFEKPSAINSVSLVFDTDITNPGTCWGMKFPHVSTCVKAYTVEVFDGKEWIKVARADDNFMRKCTHSFEAITAEKLRITVLETWGDPSARIMEIRASLEK